MRIRDARPAAPNGPQRLIAALKQGRDVTPRPYLHPMGRDGSTPGSRVMANTRGETTWHTSEVLCRSPTNSETPNFVAVTLLPSPRTSAMAYTSTMRGVVSSATSQPVEVHASSPLQRAVGAGKSSCYARTSSPPMTRSFSCRMVPVRKTWSGGHESRAPRGQWRRQRVRRWRQPWRRPVWSLVVVVAVTVGGWCWLWGITDSPTTANRQHERQPV